MNLFRFLSGTALFGLITGLSSCLNAPDYPVTPKISANSVTVIRLNDILGKRDSIIVALDFQDGDGDLGLSPTDTTGAFARDKGRNRFYENYFLQPFYKNRQGVFVPLVSTITSNGRFPRLTEVDARPGPIKGVLRRALVISLRDTAYSTLPGREYQFQVSIADRALNESNVIMTETVKL